jgi:CRISPR type III-B/RAMP module RAMP protein Cmr6
VTSFALTSGFPTGDAMPRREGDRDRASTEYLDEYLEAESPALFNREETTCRHLAGSVAFLAAVPRGRAKLVTDIVNCHHKAYYAGKLDRATDDESPNLHFFPAVDVGTSFVFRVVPIARRADAVERDYGFSPAEFALEMLREAVEIHGIGAKTAAGYGWFAEDTEGNASLKKAARDAEAKRLAAKDAVRRQATLAAMSPEDRRVEELGELPREVFIADCINPLREKDEAEQRAILRALLDKHRQLWLDDKTAKPAKKGGKRAERVREIAGKLGVELP